MDDGEDLASALMARAAALLEDASAMAADADSGRDMGLARKVEQAIVDAGRLVAEALVIMRSRNSDENNTV